MPRAKICRWCRLLYTYHANGLRNYYVFAYARTSANLNASFTPAQLGISSNAYVYDYFGSGGTVVAGSNSFNFSTTTPQMPYVGGSYFIVSPIGPLTGPRFYWR